MESKDLAGRTQGKNEKSSLRRYKILVSHGCENKQYNIPASDHNEAGSKVSRFPYS
jgi:hypothetical protein